MTNQKELINKIFPLAFERVENKFCPLCGNSITKFKDELSEKEFKISGMCQICQDDFFN